MKEKQTVRFPDCSVMKETPKAYLIDFGDWDDWVPKSQIVSFDPEYGGDLTVTKWWAEVSGNEERSEAEQEEHPSPPPANGDLRSATVVYRRLALKYHPDRAPEAAE